MRPGGITIELSHAENYNGFFIILGIQSLSITYSCMQPNGITIELSHAGKYNGFFRYSKPINYITEEATVIILLHKLIYYFFDTLDTSAGLLTKGLKKAYKRNNIFNNGRM